MLRPLAVLSYNRLFGHKNEPKITIAIRRISNKNIGIADRIPVMKNWMQAIDRLMAQLHRLVEDGLAEVRGKIVERFFEKIFEPFQRLHSHDDIAGTGLGLGICKQIVGCHDGEIYLESSSDAGSTFVLRLPVREGILKKAA